MVSFLQRINQRGKVPSNANLTWPYPCLSKQWGGKVNCGSNYCRLKRTRPNWDAGVNSVCFGTGNLKPPCTDLERCRLNPPGVGINIVSKAKGLFEIIPWPEFSERRR